MGLQVAVKVTVTIPGTHNQTVTERSGSYQHALTMAFIKIKNGLSVFEDLHFQLGYAMGIAPNPVDHAMLVLLSYGFKVNIEVEVV